MGTQSKVRSAIELGTVLLMAIASLTLIWVAAFRQPPARLSRELPLPTEAVAFEGATSLGAPGAAIAIIEFSDFECSFCQRFATETFPELKRRYIDTGKVLFLARHFPLDRHANAAVAAQVAVCAAKAGEFWTFREAVFKLNTPPDLTTIRPLNETALVQPLKLEKCMDDAGHRSVVDNDIAMGRMLGVRGTPTFFVGRNLGNGTMRVTHRAQGARPLAEFEQMLDEASAQSH